MMRFDHFVMFAEMRTGSNFLEANLNALPGVTCLGELFNPHFIGKKDVVEAYGWTIAARDADPLGFWAVVRAQAGGMAGFRLFHDHDPRVIAALLEDPRCAKIVLTRNPVDSYVSLLIARETGQWKLTNAGKHRSAQVAFDGAGFEAHLVALQEFQVRLMRGLQTTGQTAFYIDYEDLSSLEVINGLAAWLGAGGGLEALDDKLKKQNPEEITEKVLNPEVMADTLARLDRFNLSRSPNFEPRRGAAIPQALAAGGALFWPVPGGPTHTVSAWLAGLGAVQGGFSQKSLRHWLRATPQHRSFTVLRHPLARVHGAFVAMLADEMPQVRQSVQRLLKVDLPKPGKPVSDDDHRAAFLQFLRWVRMNLSGQTPLRVDGRLASQLAVVQGFGTFLPPDLILREDGLAKGLAGLVAELGHAMPPLCPEAPDLTLIRIHDAELEAAVQDIYARDFTAFGFGAWR